MELQNGTVDYVLDYTDSGRYAVFIKDISSEAEPTNVPELEPEDAVIHPPKNPGQSVVSNMEEMIEQVTEDEIKHEQEAEEQTEGMPVFSWEKPFGTLAETIKNFQEKLREQGKQKAR